MEKGTGTLTVGNLLKVAATRHRDKQMLYCVSTGRGYTFHEVNTRVNSLANALTQLGLRKGDAAAFLCNNRAEMVEIYFALAKIGVLGVPLNYRLATAEIINLMQSCDARVLLFGPTFHDVAHEIRNKLSDIEFYVGIGEDVPDFATSYEQLARTLSVDEPGTEISEEDAQYMNLTSGTTGTPKAYLLTQYSNAIAALTMTNQYDLTSRDTVLTVFPMFGRVGFAWTLIAVYAGIKNVIMDFDPKRVVEEIANHRVTITNFVPTMASILLSLPSLRQHDLSSLRAVVFAGSPLPPSVQEETKRSICSGIYEYYGMQETGAVVSMGPDEKERKPDSVGQLMPFCEVRIVSSTGSDMPSGEIGSIIVRSPASTSAYYQDQEKTSETFQGGWIHTGDLGRLDDEGFLYVTGRTKDMIVSGGQNVFSTEVEGVLMSHPAVADCAVIGLPDPKWGEAVTAVVIGTSGAQVTQEELVAYCREGIAGFKVPKTFHWRTEPIPRTPTGKVTKHVLEDEYAEHG